MENQAPLLSDQFARLRTSAQAQEPCAWLPAAVHALIMACLMRIFGRLEQMLVLWQSGCLPAPQLPQASPVTLHRDARRPRWRRPARPSRQCAQPAELTVLGDTHRPRSSAPATFPRAPKHAGIAASRHAVTSPACPHRARAPPPKRPRQPLC